MTKRELLYPEIKRLRETERLKWREIGERLGISLKTAHEYYSDPRGERYAERMRRYRATRVMPVRAVTPQVPALGGGLQFYRDLDGVDLAMDHWWDEVDPSGFYPDPKLDEFSSPRGSYTRRVRGVPQRVEPSPMHGSADHKVGLDGRSALPTSSSRESERRPLDESAPDMTWQDARKVGNAPGLTPSDAGHLRADGGPVDPGSATSASGAAASHTTFPLPGGALGGGPRGRLDSERRPDGHPGGA